ncbi:hypothetical protein PIB30_052852 [Stylosanthes scabra]|uniref:FAR1 domain-containing protein n=1 Tax=Stylosanthes scabra TaxID=79078 RepID=A0ABU6TIU6_9FABA|nr:hypothetical protein [Stylosanthes scabra]
MFNISSNLVIYLPSEKSDAKFDCITVEQKIRRYKFASRKLTSENRSTLNPTVGMTFATCAEANDFHKEYVKQAGFATKIRNSQRNKETSAIKNQLLTCNREEKRTSDIPEAEKTNLMSPANCPARIYVHIQKKTQLYVISKVVL